MITQIKYKPYFIIGNSFRVWNSIEFTTDLDNAKEFDSEWKARYNLANFISDEMKFLYQPVIMKKYKVL